MSLKFVMKHKWPLQTFRKIEARKFYWNIAQTTVSVERNACLKIPRKWMCSMMLYGFISV